MSAEALVSARQLDRLLAAGQCIVVDCRSDLGNPAKGLQDYLADHIPGARYANLDTDLSSAITPFSGRHPLPGREVFSGFLSRIGWDPGTLLVAYDERTNAFAARLWWLMRFFGQRAALLDGGLAAWIDAGLPLEPGMVVVAPSEAPELVAQNDMAVSATEVLDGLDRHHLSLVDARAPERFSGAVEPLDPVGGHIPGALSRPLARNLDASGRFKSTEQLRSEFHELLGDRPPASVVNYCGSGVTACHNDFAMRLAGLGPGKVYPGSWSEWLRDPSRPIETGS